MQVAPFIMRSVYMLIIAPNLHDVKMSFSAGAAIWFVLACVLLYIVGNIEGIL